MKRNAAYGLFTMSSFMEGMKEGKMRNRLGRIVLGLAAGILFFTLVLSGWAWSDIWPYEIIYSGRNVVDFHFGPVCSGKVKCVLTRDGQPISQWEETTQDIYCSDTSASYIHIYAFKRYAWDWEQEKWQETAWDVKETTVDTTIIRGKLHNGEEWRNKLGRYFVDWRPENDPYRIENVSLEDGPLYVAQDTQVVFLKEGGELKIKQGASLHANGATFVREDEATGMGTISLYAQAAGDSSFEGCTIVDVYVYAEDSKGIHFTGNAITKTPAYGWSSMIRLDRSSDTLFENNTGNAYVELYGENNVVRNNTLSDLSVRGTGLVEGNTCGRVSIGASENGMAAVRRNAMKSVGASIGAPVIEDNTVTGDAEAGYNGRIECADCVGAMIRGNSVKNFEEIGIYIHGGSGNTVEGNRIEAKQRRYETSSAGIELWNTENNLIKKNNILGVYGRGIHIYMAMNNHIEYNAINNSTLEGIFLEHSYSYCTADSLDGSSDNVIAFNHIWKNLYGVHASESKGCHKRNGIHDNIIAENGTGVRLGWSNTDNTVYNNVFRGNAMNGRDNDGRNRWYHDKTLVNSNIVGGPYLGGNFWSDYAGTDADGDGLGDTPYDIRNYAGTTVTQQDNLPLIDKGYSPPVIHAEPAPCFFVQPFGGSAVTKTLSVSNRGGSDLAMGEASISGGGAAFFTLTKDACKGVTMVPQAVCLIEMTFTAPDGSEKKADVLLPSNDPVTPVLWVGISGTKIIQSQPGDVNGDGVVNLFDAVLALQVLVGSAPDGQNIVQAADVNSDSRIGLAEVIFVLQKTGSLR